MNRDIRLSVGFWQHPKTKKLVKRLGLEGIRSLQILWLWAAQNKPDGCLAGMDWEDIELAADWQGEEGAFFEHCLGVWIDEDDRGYLLHDWTEHNPWQAEAGARSEKARESARARWDRMRENAPAMPAHETGNAQSMRPECDRNASAMRPHETSNAPLPSPSPEERREKGINTPPHPPAGGEAGKPKRKREATGNSKAELSALIERYTSSAPLRQTLEDFRAMRERMRKPLTGKALELILRDLDRLSPDSDEGKQAVLEQSIKNGWQGVFALKDNLPAPRDGPRPPSGGAVDFYGNPRPRATTQYQKMAQDREDIARICNQLWEEKERSENGRQALSG